MDEEVDELGDGLEDLVNGLNPGVSVVRVV